MKILLHPVEVRFGTPLLTKKLFCAERDAPPPPVNIDPLTYNPVLLTLRRSQVPAPIITVLDKLEVPNMVPIIVLLLPVVTAQPEHCPMKVLLHPVVLEYPAAHPKKLLLLPVVLEYPAQCPKKLL